MVSTWALAAVLALFRTANANASLSDEQTPPDDTPDVVPGAFIVNNATDDETGEIASQIAARPEVKNIWPVKIVNMPMPSPIIAGKNATAFASSSSRRRRDAETDSYTPHVMTQVDKLKAEGYTGKGIRIAIVDSGVDYTHPALGGCFGEGCLIAYGRDLVGDNYSPPGEPEPDADPFDNCVGHGTHVAGIIAAQANELNFTGAAPDVTLGMYRAWGCTGQSTNDIMLDAFNAAFEDGSDIISYSAGYYTGWANDPWAIATSRIAAAGVSVIVAPGNSGSSGLFLSATPATGVNVTAIGSVDNIISPLLLTAASYAVDNDTGSSLPFGYLDGGPAFADKVSLPLWAVSNSTTSTDDACSPLSEDTPDLSNRIVLLRVADSSVCSSWQQGNNVAAKGGKYLLYYSQSNSSFGTISPYSDGTSGVGVVTPSQAAEWISLLNQGSNVTINIEDPTAAGHRYEYLDNKVSGGLTSISSSWGPSWEAVSKPQFTAPGGNILSTYPMNMGEYAVLSGTSIATPLAAAIFALIAEARETTDPFELRSVISSTSKPRPWFDGTTVHEIFAPVAQQGSGLIQAYKAAHAITVISVGQISFNDTDHFSRRQTFSVKNTGDKDLTCNLGHTKAATAYTFAPGSHSVSQFPNPIADDWAELSFSPEYDQAIFSSPLRLANSNYRKLTVPAGTSREVTVIAVPPKSVNATQLPVYSGLITLSTSNDESYNIPYLGVAGSIKSTPVLLEGPEYGTFLGTFGRPDPANKTFVIPRPGTTPPPDAEYEYPGIVASVLFGTQMIRADVVALTDTDLPVTEFFDVRSIGSMPSFPDTWVIRRNYRLAFTGELANGTVVPEGSFKLVFSALRVFGDAKKKEDWDFAETVPFNVEYL
ncbi:subtilisin-like serine protease pr1c [Fusarium albosuccineum]|uniref:Subtilisin-like serine protease pr1c n=1 Tax=Fusarium albosuccineum TaxID=1237068 RepID=A0A8H4KTA6_9HYPO|nr:subtilisin-like serine protease pr1c [Fusarium albosuccineum]